MYCLNCKKIIPDGLETCPECGKSLKPERCPECWNKLEDTKSTCTKCGCDIDRYIKEKEAEQSTVEKTIWDRIKELPLWIKIAAPTFAAVLIAAIAGTNIYLDFRALAQAKAECLGLVEKADASMELIGEMAEVYDRRVYSKDWLKHTENASEVREDFKDEISKIDDMRQPIIYANETVAKSGDKKLAALSEDVYYAYSSCYTYVVGEKGKYPHYLENYEKLFKEYEKAVDKLEKELNK